MNNTGIKEQNINFEPISMENTDIEVKSNKI